MKRKVSGFLLYFKWQTAFTVLVLTLAFTQGCAHKTNIRSTPPGAQVFVDDKAVGQTPCEIGTTKKKIRVQHEDTTIEFRLKTHNDWRYTLVNTAGACFLSASLAACVGGGLWALGSGLSVAMPVIGPIFAVCGSPPAACGTVLWSGIFSLGASALVLPFQVLLNSEVGPESIDVDLKEDKIRSDPPRLFIQRSDSPKPAEKAMNKGDAKTDSKIETDAGRVVAF